MFYYKEVNFLHVVILDSFIILNQNFNFFFFDI